MSLTGILAAVTPKRVTSDDKQLNVQGTRDGAIYTADWLMARSIEGRVFTVNGGTLTTPITFGAGTIDSTEPDLHGAVDATSAVIPLEISIVMEAFGTDALFEAMAAIGTGGAAGTDTAVTATSLRTDAPINSITVWGDASAADATYSTTNVSEIFRTGLQKVATVGTGDDDSSRTPAVYTWRAKNAGIYPVLVGASQLQVYAAAQAGTGFVSCTYVEVPVTMVTG